MEHTFVTAAIMRLLAQNLLLFKYTVGLLYLYITHTTTTNPE
jgi:hypothetical protein